VVKRYATVTAVDHVSLEVDSGARFAFIRSNGAGKSSLIRMVLGLTRPNAGTITLNLDGRHAALARPSRQASAFCRRNAVSMRMWRLPSCTARPLAILDKPFSGFNPVDQEFLFDLIRD